MQPKTEIKQQTDQQNFEVIQRVETKKEDIKMKKLDLQKIKSRPNQQIAAAVKNLNDQGIKKTPMFAFP